MTKMPQTQQFTRQQLEAHWMAYTGNRQFKDDPRMIVA
ncbi:MAG: beta-alanine--pyruvate transaminase, partial [Halioglobus sp.]